MGLKQIIAKYWNLEDGSKTLPELMEGMLVLYGEELLDSQGDDFAAKSMKAMADYDRRRMRQLGEDLEKLIKGE